MYKDKQPDDLAIVGNIDFPDPVNLSVKNELTIIGNPHFHSGDIEAKDIRIIGGISAHGEIRVNADKIERISGEDIEGLFKGNAGSAATPAKAESDAEKTEAVQTDENAAAEAAVRESLGLSEEAYLNFDYLVESAKQAKTTPEQYVRYLEHPQLDMETVTSQKIYDQIMQRQAEELEKIFGPPQTQNAAADAEAQALYQNTVSAAANPMPDYQEIPLM